MSVLPKVFNNSNLALISTPGSILATKVLGYVGVINIKQFYPQEIPQSQSQNSKYGLSLYLENAKGTMIKYTTQFLTKLEDMVAESDYTLRYEKGNFKSGYCVLKDQKIIIVNKFYPTEGKINAMLDILKNVQLDSSRFTEKSIKLWEDLFQQSAAA
jgi:hypothetical protein